MHESIHVVRPGSAPVYSAGAAAAQQAEEGSGSGLQGQVALLEEMVQRLSAELGKHLVAAGEAAGGQGQAQGSQLLSQVCGGGPGCCRLPRVRYYDTLTSACWPGGGCTALEMQ